MLRLRMVFALTAASLGALAAAQPGCAASVHSQAGDGDSPGSTGGATGASASQSAPSASVTATSSATTGSGGAGGQSMCGPYDGLVFAVNELFLGDRTFTKVKSPNAWMDFGFDLDGQNTTNDFSKHCQPA